jgi:MFS family permease
MPIAFGPLWRHRNFLRLWAAQAVSAFGSRITRTALPIIAIVTVSATPFDLALLSSLEVIPAIVVGALAGGWIDRSRKRRMLIMADIVRAGVVLSIPLVAWWSTITIVQLYAIAVVVGGASALFRLADLAYLPRVIGREHLIEGNSKLATTESIAEIGGPGLAGILIQVLTAPIAMLLDALSYLWSAAMLARIDTEERVAPVATARSSVIDDVRIGIRAGFGHPQIGPTLWALGIGSFADGFFMSLYMLYAIDTLGIGIATIGLLIGLGGIGALAGAMVASGTARWLGLGRALLVTMAIGKAMQILVALASELPSLTIALFAAQQLIGDGLLVAHMILSTSFRQAMLHEDVMARANGMLQVMHGVLLPAGAALGAAIASAVSVTAAVWTGTILGLFAVLPLLRRNVLGLRMPTRIEAAAS